MKFDFFQSFNFKADHGSDTPTSPVAILLHSLLLGCIEIWITMYVIKLKLCSPQKSNLLKISNAVKWGGWFSVRVLRMARVVQCFTNSKSETAFRLKSLSDTSQVKHCQAPLFDDLSKTLSFNLSLYSHSIITITLEQIHIRSCYTLFSVIVDTDGSTCVTAAFSFGLDSATRNYQIHAIQYDR